MMISNANLTQTLVERSKSFKEPYEFLFKINDNIIVQRFFTVNGYNPQAVYSLDFKLVVDECVAVIKNEMKNRALDFMDEFKYYFEDNPDFECNSSQDMYYFQVRINGKVVIESGWDGTIYPAKIRHDVNIKRFISRIINTIQSVLSMPTKLLTTKYEKYDLTRIESDTTKQTC